jgi:cell division protein FtsI (penicillin-binding protein 3)
VIGSSKFRIIFVLFFVILCLLIIFFRTIQVKFFPNKKLVKYYENQYKGKIFTKPKRGDIFDKKSRPLAISLEYKHLIVNPSKIENCNKVAKVLSSELNLNYKEVFKIIKDKKRKYYRLKKFLSEKEELILSKIVSLEEGLYFEETYKRNYPNKTLASHILGFVNHNQIGKTGVEYYYDNYLSSDKKIIPYEKDGRARAIFSHNLWKEDINEIYLTIDNDIQYRIEEELKLTYEKWNALSATVIVMDPHTGKIISLANYPTFDPNEPGKYSAHERRNKAIMDIFEPGSTFKIITAGIALKNKLVSLEEEFWGEEGRFKIHDRVIREAQGHDYENMNISKIISKSSNIGSAKLGLRIGKEKMYEGVKEFGFGKKTYIDLPGEIKGLINYSGRDIRIATMSFGQGISVTPIQLIKAYSIIANGGYNIIPHVVEKIVTSKGESLYAMPYRKDESIINKETAKILSGMLRMAVTSGTGIATDIKGFEVAGKTGTAQKAGIDGYDDEKHVASFAGFFPISNPKYSILVLVDEPKASHYGSVVAVPLFRKIVNIIVQSKDVSPIDLEDDFKKENINYEIKEKKFDIKKIKKQEGLVPDFKGLTLREVLTNMTKEWEDIKIHGMGIVYEQKPLAGTKLKKNDKIELWLK